VLCEAAGVPRIALHDARDTSATLSAANGVDLKTLQARMGHGDAKILTELYLHLVTPAGRVAADTIEGAMLGRRLRAA
jgi:integrase